MKIQPVNPNFDVTKSTRKTVQKTDQAPDKNRSDTYTPTKEEKNITYEKPAYKIDTETIERLKAEAEKNYATLRQLIQQLLEKQGITLETALAGEITVEIDETTRVEAEVAISDGGYLSPENVSNRIVDFAIAISGGDTSKISLLKDAIDEGFQAAADILGGTLPEISQETYDLVMKKLNDWANGE